MRADTRTLFLALFATSLVAGPALADGISLPAADQSTLDNGMRLQLVRHATVPMVTLEMWIAGGSSEDPRGKEGLAALTADALRKGSGELDAQQFADALGFLGARLSTSADVEKTRVTLSLLSEDLEQGLDLLAGAILDPRLDQAEVEKLRDQMAESVAQAKDNPRNVLGEYHLAHLFGDHPYGRPTDGTETSLPTITVDDVRRFHREQYGADRVVLTVVGDIDPTSVRTAIEKRFAKMPRASSALPSISAPSAPERTNVLLVDEPDTPQTWFMIGALGPSWHDTSDYAATELVRTVFGGRFTSWLNKKLRVEAGLTYGARYSMQRYANGGWGAISTFTATETTREAIDLALAQLDRLHDEGLTEEDLASAKAYVKGQEPYDYETSADLARVFSRLAFYGIDRDMVDGFFAAVDAVTLDDCRRVVDRWFTRDALSITAIGVRPEIEEILGSYGPVTVRPNEAPGFSATVVAGSR